MYLKMSSLIEELRGYVSNPDSLDKYQLAQTVLFALRDIGSSAVGTPVTKELPAMDGIVKFPKDLLRLRDLKNEGGQLMYEVSVLDSHHSGPLEFLRLEDEVMVHSCIDKVFMVYYALPIDNEGLPLIDEDCFEAVVSRCLSRAKLKETFKNKGITRADLQLQIYLDRDSDTKIARARGNSHTPTRAKARTIAKRNKRFFDKP